MINGRQLDGRVGHRVAELASWWTQATQEARFRLLEKACKENSPPLETLKLAIILSELEAGEVDQG